VKTHRKDYALYAQALGQELDHLRRDVLPKITVGAEAVNQKAHDPGCHPQPRSFKSLLSQAAPLSGKAAIPKKQPAGRRRPVVD
jgi:hypothetical protein